ncbi:hypothetical protein OY671_006433 [Metschnikowia pulcherrima]|nr:hypothetical protein OY671_006433 [Metschnikowia pulcherrima]
MQSTETMSHGKGPEGHSHTRVLESDVVSESGSDHDEEEISAGKTLVDEPNSFTATYVSVVLSQFDDSPITTVDPFRNCQGNPRLELLLQCSGKLELWLFPLMSYQHGVEYSRLKDPLEELNRMFPEPRETSSQHHLASDIRNTMRKLNAFNDAFWDTSHEVVDPVLLDKTNALMGCFEIVVRDLAAIDPTGESLYLLDFCRRRAKRLFLTALEYFYDYQRLEKSPDSIRSYKLRFGKGHFIIDLSDELEGFRRLVNQSSIGMLQILIIRATRRIGKTMEGFLAKLERVDLRAGDHIDTIRANAMLQMAYSCGYVWTRKCLNIVKLLTMMHRALNCWLDIFDGELDDIAHYVWCIKHGVSMLFARIGKHARLDEKLYTHADHVDESCRALLALFKKGNKDFFDKEWCEEWGATHDCLQKFLDSDLCPVADRLRESAEQSTWL